jgi:RIO-like serine/threonine protein kinase
VKGALRTTWAARSPAQREFEALARLVVLPAGPFSPEPLAWTEHRVHGVLRACALVLAEAPDATDLATWLTGKPSGTRTSTLIRLARRVREMHDARLVDFEMHARNVLVARDGSVFKVDCAKQRRRRRALSVADRARDLAALDVALTRLASPAERDAFFAAYGVTSPLAAAVRRELARIDARESRRLPK